MSKSTTTANLFVFTEDEAHAIVGESAKLLASKTPSEVHHLHAAIGTAATGIHIDPKVVQIVLSLHGKIQRSDANKTRESYRASYDRAERGMTKDTKYDIKPDAVEEVVEEPKLTPQQKAAATRRAKKAAAEKANA